MSQALEKPRASSEQGSALELEAALEEIRAGAAARDSERIPLFPRAPFRALQRAGALSFNARADRRRPPAAAELALVRRVAAADGSVGRIFDGHLNAVERLAVQGPHGLCEQELDAVRSGTLWAGVWGGEPNPDEGPAATVVSVGGRPVLRGVKTFCSGAGGLNRALVLCRDGRADSVGQTNAQPIAVWIDVGDPQTVEIDESWYRSHGLVASASHRVVFHDAPVLAQFGEAGAFAEQPWIGRDALRTAASWAGMADSAAAAALELLAQRRSRTQLEDLAAGRILTAQRTLDVWLDHAARVMDARSPELEAISLHARASIADACRALLDEAARACGSWPFARANPLDRARRDLELFLLQHRLDPLLARAGAAALDGLT